MAQTVGQYSLGGTTMNYMVSGQLIYGYGFDGLDSGFHHSHLDLSTSTSIRHGIDVTFNTGVRDIYDLRDDDYETKADVSLKLSKDNHDLKVGYDKNIANKILGNKMKMNGDTSLSKNAIGQKFSGYDAFVEYNYAVQNYILITSADFDGNLYSGLSVYANDFDVKIHVFEHQDDFNVFFDVGTVIGEQIKTSLGFGLNQEKLSFIADGSYFVTDTLNLYGNVLGDEDYSTATVGAEYVYGSFAAYAEGVVALTSPKVSGQSQDGVLLGAKFMF
ncbi:hypothetical protein [Photobacterium galatheae]|nr:hypothetical protein [Photobacterium galatheae]MCM0149100.1 hypothetical protein [Photobacterium galatheae]